MLCYIIFKWNIFATFIVKVQIQASSLILSSESKTFQNNYLFVLPVIQTRLFFCYKFFTSKINNFNQAAIITVYVRNKIVHKLYTNRTCYAIIKNGFARAIFFSIILKGLHVYTWNFILQILEWNSSRDELVPVLGQSSYVVYTF